MALDDDARRRAAETKRTRTKAAIESAAWRLLKYGADDVTYSAVAQLAQVSEATVYRYYPSKNELVESAATSALANEDVVGLCREFASAVEGTMPLMLGVWRTLMAQALEVEERDEVAAVLLDRLLTPAKLPPVSVRGLEFAGEDEGQLPKVSTEGLDDL